MGRRVVITSMGVISPIGSGPKDIINNLKNRNVNFTRLKFHSTEQLCATVKNFNLTDYTGRYKNSRYLNRGAQFCVAAAMEAVKNSGLKKSELIKAGLFTGAGPNLAIDDEIGRITDKKMDTNKLPALWILRFLPNTASSAIAALAGVHSENNTIGTACASSLQAIGEAYRKIHHGYLDFAFAGGGDSRISHGGITAYRKAHTLFTGNGPPGYVYAPFDENRRGFVPGEGGAFFLLEELEHAAKRGALIYGEISGMGASIDGYNMTAPEPEGKWAEIAVRSALKNAEITPEDIGLISSHGTGTALNDSMETALIERIFGENRPCVIALKSWIGHLAAACGAVELAISLICLSHSYFPEIKNLKKPCSADVNFITKGKEYAPHNIILENFGFGGQNCALVLKKWKK